MSEEWVKNHVTGERTLTLEVNPEKIIGKDTNMGRNIAEIQGRGLMKASRSSPIGTRIGPDSRRTENSLIQENDTDMNQVLSEGEKTGGRGMKEGTDWWQIKAECIQVGSSSFLQV